MSPARYRMAGAKGVMSYYSGIPKKFRLLWIQFLKSTVFYGVYSKKVFESKSSHAIIVFSLLS